MTTSFTNTEQFGTQIGDEFGGGSNYPEAFGITFTPQVTGITAGVAGFLIAAYLVWTQVLPALNSYSTLQTERKEQEQIFSQLTTLKIEEKIQRKKAELEEAKDIQQEVIKLFAHQTSLETLLIDLNNFVNATNVKLISYAPGNEEVVTDSSWGELANGKVKRQSYNLDVEGSFTQLQLLLQDIERLQPLLVVKNFNANIAGQQNYLLEQDKLVVSGQPKLKTTITVDAILPNWQELQANPAPAEQAQQPQ
jgi:hypothetical protein